MSESSQSVQVRVNQLVRCSCLSYDVDSVVTSVSQQTQRPQPRCTQSASNTAAVEVKIHHDKLLANSQERGPGSSRQCSAVPGGTPRVCLVVVRHLRVTRNRCPAQQTCTRRREIGCASQTPSFRKGGFGYPPHFPPQKCGDAVNGLAHWLTPHVSSGE